MNIFRREDPKTKLEGLIQAQQILDDRFSKGQVSNELYQKQSLEFMKRKEKYEKELKKRQK